MASDAPSDPKLKEEIAKIFDIVGPSTTKELSDYTGKTKYYIMSALREMINEYSAVSTRISPYLHVYHKVGQIDNKVTYVHAPKPYKRREPLNTSIAGVRTWHSAGMPKLSGYAMPAPARADAMDALRIPSRGFA